MLEDASTRFCAIGKKWCCAWMSSDRSKQVMLWWSKQVIGCYWEMIFCFDEQLIGANRSCSEGAKNSCPYIFPRAAGNVMLSNTQLMLRVLSKMMFICILQACGCIRAGNMMRLLNRGLSPSVATFTCILKACGGNIGAADNWRKKSWSNWWTRAEKKIDVGSNIMICIALVDMYVNKHESRYTDATPCSQEYVCQV